MNAVAPIGHNQPPEELTGFAAIAVHLDDLLTEARNWADGSVAETQEHADEISRLIQDLKDGAAEADKLRVAEKKPFDDAAAEVQTRYNVYLAPTTNKTIKGKVPLAIDALDAAKRPFLLKREAELAAEREAARKVAEEAAAKAAEAARAAAPDDLEAREAAELLVAQAHRAESAARQAEAAKAHAHGGNRATGLKSYWVPTLTDRKAALLHYLADRPADLAEWLMSMARQDIVSGKKVIPGFDVIEERR